MSFHKSDKILDEWQFIANRATPPTRAPRGGRSRSLVPAAVAGAIGLALVAAVLGPRMLPTTGPAPSGSPSLSGRPRTGDPTASAPVVMPTIQPTPSGAATPFPSSASTPAPTPQPKITVGPSSATTFTTPGTLSNWTGFDWSPVGATNPLLGAAADHKIVSWAHGYAMTETVGDTAPSAVWTSPDGLTWTKAIAGSKGVEVAAEIAAGPAGLMVIESSGLSEQASSTLWLNRDGTAWSAGTLPSGIPWSLAGTDRGYVAITRSGGGTFQAEFSSDGATWTTDSLDLGAASTVTVDAANGRFFVTAGPTMGASLGARGIFASSLTAGAAWWSDDGRTWTKATGLQGYGSRIDAVGPNLLMTAASGGVPGGNLYLWSHDDGQTWEVDPTWGPLGAAECTGECSTEPDGSIASTGSFFLAVKSDGKAWTSADGRTWTPISWAGPKVTGPNTLRVLPRGVLVSTPGEVPVYYGAAK